MKLKPTDLRIGNFVTWIDDEDEPDTYMCLTVQGLVGDGTIWVGWEWEFGEGDSTDCGLDDIKPIPITPKWLERLGFKASNGFPYSKCTDEYENTSLIVDEDICYYGISINGKIVWSISRKINVHQLQNLYFALTGEELKPNKLKHESILRT